MNHHHRFASIVLLLVFLTPTTHQKPINAHDHLSHVPINSFRVLNSPSNGIDLDVTYISREPRYNWDETKQWPDPSEQVIFTAHIINRGTTASGNYYFEWKVDDQVVSSGMANGILPQAESTQKLYWDWQVGRHYISFEADPQNLLSENAENNNVIKDATDALALGFWVEESVYNYFRNNPNGVGTYSWEDWAQWFVGQMNWMFAQSKYPLAPDGILTRVKLDKVTLAEDGTLYDLGPTHAPFETSTDAQWGFNIVEHVPGSELYINWSTIHELGHYLLGRVDLYGLDVQGGDVGVLDEEGNPIAGTPQLPFIAWDVVHYNSRGYDIMSSGSNPSLYSDHNVYSINRDWPLGQRTHNGWNYIYDIPLETKLRVLDENNEPLANMKVSVYQAVYGDGSSGAYSQYFDNVPDVIGVTDVDGLVSIGNDPLGTMSNGITAGIGLTKLEHPLTDQVRYQWLELVDLNLAYWQGEEEIYIHDLYYSENPRRLKVSSNEISFTAYEGSDPIPKNVIVDILGQGIQQWMVSVPTVSWLRTIPSPQIWMGPPYPPGPLTLITDTSELSAGSYDTSLIVSAEDITDSPQTITVTLNVVDPPPPSSISGNVVDSLNNPIAGVVISDEIGHTTTTNAVGNYLFSDLTAGTYTLTPSKTNYTFIPASKMATVPPNAVGVNFKTIEKQMLKLYLPIVSEE